MQVFGGNGQYPNLGADSDVGQVSFSAALKAQAAQVGP